MTASTAEHSRHLVVNADDLGQSACINAGISAAVDHGIVTSASMMVRWPAAADAAAWARRRPQLSVGLHLDLGEWIVRGGEWEALYEVVDAEDADAVGEEIRRQLQRFGDLMGHAPTHLDSHQHTHMREPVRSLLVAEGQRLGVHVRGLSGTRYCGDFYGQWGAGESHPESISRESLITILDDLHEGTTELACHPSADNTDDLESMYLVERGFERRVLCDPSLRDEIATRAIVLRSFGAQDRVR